MTDPDGKLPAVFIDAHHHFIDTTSEIYADFLRSVASDLIYTAEQYQEDVVADLRAAGIEVAGSVHVEAMPDDGAAEAGYVQGLVDGGRAGTVGTGAIVGSVDLAKADAGARIEALVGASGLVRGVRWILDCVGRFEGGKTATHVATSRHDGVDYLRGSEGGYGGGAVPAFEAGYGLLAGHGLSFDLQCAPAQLKAAAALASRHPGVPVVIDHLGKPRMLLGDDMEGEGDARRVNPNTNPDQAELDVWREGMRAMAALPHVMVKIGMLGYAVPGWTRTPEREALVRELVLEVVDLFGPSRCMCETNWWANASASDADFLSDAAPSPSELLAKLSSWFAGYTDEEREMLLSGSAKKFYRL